MALVNDPFVLLTSIVLPNTPNSVMDTSFEGQTFVIDYGGGSGDTIITTATFDDANNDGFIQDSEASSPDTVSIPEVNGGGFGRIYASQGFFGSTVTFSDGSTQQIYVATAALESGHVYFDFFDTDVTGTLLNALQGGQPNIESITLGTLDTTNYTGFTATEWDEAWAPVCFATGTRILTTKGRIPVERLRVGDLVHTYDAGTQPIRWIGGRTTNQPGSHAPIRFEADSLGKGFPERDLQVSPQHRMLVCSKIAARMFDSKEALVAAKKLLGWPGIEQMPGNTPITYWHLLFDSHQIVMANGAWSESLLPGRMARKSLPPEALCEISDILPEAFDAANTIEAIAARPILKGARLRTFLDRHRVNQKPFFMSDIVA